MLHEVGQLSNRKNCEITSNVNPVVKTFVRVNHKVLCYTLPTKSVAYSHKPLKPEIFSRELYDTQT